MDLLKMYFLYWKYGSLFFIAMYVYRTVNNSSIETTNKMFRMYWCTRKYLECQNTNKSFSPFSKRFEDIMLPKCPSQKSQHPPIHQIYPNYSDFSQQKTNSAPKNMPSQMERSLPTIIFQVPLCFFSVVVRVPCLNILNLVPSLLHPASLCFISHGHQNKCATR